MVRTIRTRRAPRDRTFPLSRTGALAWALAIALAGTPAVAQTPKKTPPATNPPTQPGLPPATGVTVVGTGRFLVGDAAPDVNLNDQDGRAFHLAEARRTKPWLLVFARRARDLVDVEEAAPGIDSLGMGAVVIAPFGREQVRGWVRKPRLPLLFDRASVTARTYGVFDPVTTNPRPGAFLIDQRGRILWMISGALPSASELVRMTREALEASREQPAAAEVSG